MCLRENVKHEISKNDDLTRKIDESLVETNRKLDLVGFFFGAHVGTKINKVDSLSLLKN